MAIPDEFCAVARFVEFIATGRKVILGELNRRRHIEPDEEGLLGR